MGTENDASTVAEAVSTPAAAEPVESTPTQESTVQADEPRTAADVWDNIDTETEDGDAEPPAEEPAEPDAPADEPDKEDKQETDDDDKSPEDLALEEAFADEDVEKKDGESDKEEDLDKLDPKEMLERQRNAQARAWAERNAKKAEIVKDFQYDKPIAEVAAKLEEISPQRYVELSQHAAYKLVDSNPDAAFQRAYAVKMLQNNPNWDIRTATLPTLDEFIANGVGVAQSTTTQTATPRTAIPEQLADATAELDAQLGWDWRDPNLDDNFVDERELAMVKTIRGLEAKAIAESGKNKELGEKLEGLTTSQQSTEQKEIEAELTKTVNEYRGEIEKKVLPYIAKNTGLEISDNDTPEIKAFKENRMLLYKGTDYERANNLPSQFESFAYNESTVRNELETITERVVSAQIKEVRAKRAGNKADADEFHREAADEMVGMFQLFGQANKEFKAKFIAPDMALIGKLSSKLTEPIKEASGRVEVVSNGSSPGASKPRQKDYQTADDVWGGMIEDAAQEEKLRAAA